MIHRLTSRLLTALVALSLGACASQGPVITQTGSLSPQANAPAPSIQTVSRLPADSGYILTETDRALDCRTLTGRMAVRIVQLRDYESRAQTTAVSRAIQSTATPIFGGGPTISVEPDVRYARDRAQLAAYNTLLAEKKCANFNLDTELSPAAKGPPRTQTPARS